MRSEHQRRVDDFMDEARQQLPERPTVPSEEVRLLRAKLILEEAMETLQALGVSITAVGDDATEMAPVKFNFHASHKPDLIEIADGCADLSVVTIGTLSACGIDDKELFEAVDQNNLDKFGPGHSIREDGKLVKPPGHKPPDIAGVLRAQGWEG